MNGSYQQILMTYAASHHLQYNSFDALSSQAKRLKSGLWTNSPQEIEKVDVRPMQQNLHKEHKKIMPLQIISMSNTSINKVHR